MESLDNSKSPHTFFKHVFNFNEESKGELLNIIQYSLLALIPIVIINKIMQKYVPEANEDKGSLEITLEIFLQIIGMFVGIFFTDRIITYFPTYSGIKYLEFSVTNIILAVLIITLSLQTKLGEKVSILVDRVSDLWNGASADGSSNKKKKRGGSNSSPNANANMPPGNGVGMRDMNPMSGIVPMGPPGHPPSIPTQVQKQQLPDYNNMYRNDSNPLSGANAGGQGQGQGQGGQYSMFDGPMAANEALGGGMFGGSGF